MKLPLPRQSWGHSFINAVDDKDVAELEKAYIQLVNRMNDLAAARIDMRDALDNFNEIDRHHERQN